MTHPAPPHAHAPLHGPDRALPEPAQQPAQPARCTGCDHAPAVNGHLCGPCERALVELPDLIRRDFARLDATPHGSGAGLDLARIDAPVYGPRPGARVDVLALTTAPARPLHRLPGPVGEAPARLVDAALASRARPREGENPCAAPGGAGHEPAPGSGHEVARAHEPTVITVGRVVDRCREDGLVPALRGPRTVAGECLRLAAPGVGEELPYRWWAGEVLGELRGAHAALRAALGEVEPSVPLGRCTRPVLGPAVLVEPVDGGPPTARRTTTRCEGVVRSRDGGRSAVCSTDRGHRWHGHASVLALAGQVGDARLDAAHLAAYLDGLGYGEVPVPLLHKWASRDGWARVRRGRRTLYRLGDALVSAARHRPRRGVALAEVAGRLAGGAA